MIGTHRTTTTNIPLNNEQSRLIVTFHNTAVVQVVNDRYVVLNSGGWLTPTTKRRMNQASEVYRLNYLVYQKNYTCIAIRNTHTHSNIIFKSFVFFLLL